VKFTRTALFLGCIVVATYCLPQIRKREGAALKTGGSCGFSGSGVVAHCILHSEEGNLFIAPDVLKELHFDSHGLAQVRSEEDSRHLWMYVNRKGRVVVTGVPSFDNWADNFSDGLVRTVVKDKYGFSNRQGRIVINPAYDWASPFSHGYSEVCNQCREMCAMPGGAVEVQSVSGGCDHRIMVGGEWFKIDRKGHVAARLQR
jgi:hypothetical protein